jgi:hypothetical protein
MPAFIIMAGDPTWWDDHNGIYNDIGRRTYQVVLGAWSGSF